MMTYGAVFFDGQESGRIVDRNHVRWARDNLVRSIERFSAD